MKIQPPNTNEKGSAVIVILILLFLMVAFSMANSRALSHLKREMQMTEAQQMKKFQNGTNHVSALEQGK